MNTKSKGIKSVFWNKNVGKYSVNLPIQNSKNNYKSLKHFDSVREAKLAFLVSLPHKTKHSIYLNKES